jgi:hypothetical protein
MKKTNRRSGKVDHEETAGATRGGEWSHWNAVAAQLSGASLDQDEMSTQPEEARTWTAAGRERRGAARMEGEPTGRRTRVEGSDGRERGAEKEFGAGETEDGSGESVEVSPTEAAAGG